MTALNLTNELLAAKQKLKAEQQDLDSNNNKKKKIALLQSTIEQAIAPLRKKQA